MYPPEFHTSEFSLKPYSREDEDRFLEMAMDKESVAFMEGASGTEPEERALFERIFLLYGMEDHKWCWIWGIYSHNILCGHLEVKETTDTNNDELEIVFMMHPDKRQKGLMTKVLSFVKIQQGKWQKRIIATVDPMNSRSLALLQHWGVAESKTLVNRESGKPYLKLTLAE